MSGGAHLPPRVHPPVIAPISRHADVTHTPAPRRQRGASLIELLVGLIIGLLVAVAAMGTLVSTRTTALLVGDSTRLQQEAATAFRVIGSVVRQAGARRLENTSAGGQVVFNPSYAGYGTDPATAHPYSLKGTDGVSGKPDTLEIRRDRGLSDDESVDCLGELTAEKAATRKTGTDQGKPEQPVSNAFSVIADRLSCDGSGDTPGAHGLVGGVEDFQVWYGLREGDTLRYVTATTLGSVTAAPWGQVETLRVCLRLVAGANQRAGAATTGCQGETVATDGRMRRVFFRVFKLRNAGL